MLRRNPRMLTWLKANRLLVGMLAAAAVASIAIVLSSQTFQSCMRANAYGGDGNAADHVVWMGWWCLGILFDKSAVAITALATVFMAAFTGTLWWSTNRSTEFARRTGDLAERQFLLEGRQADLAAKQHELSRLQHVVANKPRLHIRGIVLGPIGPKGEFFVEGQKIVGSLIIANRGATDARIIDSGYRFFWSQEGLPMRPPVDDGDVSPMHLPDDGPIAGFGSRGIQLESKMPLDVKGDLIFGNYSDGVTLFIIGFIHYADINQAERYMGFCRVYLPPDGTPRTGTEGRFVAIDNGDYEYED